MLHIFRQQAKSWLIKAAFFIIIVVFISWGGYSYQSRLASRVARVGDSFVTLGEFNRVYDRLIETYRRQLGDLFSQDFARRLNVKGQALDQIVNRIVVLKAATEMGLDASPADVQAAVVGNQTFQTDGKFDFKRYTELLRANRLTPETFERQLAEDLTMQKVQAFIQRQAVVTDDEARAEFRFQNTKAEIRYALLDPRTFEAQVKIEDAALAAYHKEHAKKYEDPERRKLLVAAFTPQAYTKDVTVSEAEARAFYETHPDQFKREAEVRARHIFLRIPEKATEEQIADLKALAESITTEAKAPGADFVALVAKYSQDITAPEGDLGYFTKKQMVPEFADVVFDMKPGEIKGPIRTQFGFHVVKVEDVKPEKNQTFEEARPQIEQSVKLDAAREIAFKNAKSFADLATAEGSVAKAAAARSVATREADWISRTDPLPGLGALPPQAANQIFGLPEKTVSGVIETPAGFAVVEVQGVREPATLPIEKVRAQVEKDYRADEAKKLAKARAEELLAAAKKDKNLEAAAAAFTLPVKTSTAFSRKEPDQTLPLTGPALSAVFQLEQPGAFPETPIETPQGFLVFTLASRVVPTDEAFQKARWDVISELMGQKGAELWMAWLENARKNEKIEIYQQP